MQDSGVRAGADDGGVGPGDGAAAAVHRFDGRLHLILEHAWGGGAHPGHLRLGRDVGGFRQLRQFVRCLHHAQRLQRRRGIDGGIANVAVAQVLHKGLGAGRRGARFSGVHRDGDARAPLAERREERGRFLLVDRGAVAALAEDAVEKRLEAARRQYAGDAGPLARVVATEQASGPVLALGVAVLDEQQLATGRVAGHQHQDGVFLRHAGQVVEVAVLVVFVVDVVGVDAGGGAA